MSFKTIVSSIGHYLPEKCVSNNDLPKILDTTDEWIQNRTGIKQRHIASAHETTSFMAAQAAKEALLRANVDAADVDTIVLATTTPDHAFPASATRVQALIGAVNAFAFDVQAVCSGFIYALSVADNFIKAGQAKKVLLIGSESMSRFVDWTDRGTCVLFGDGAAALLLQAADASHPSDVTGGVLSTHLYSNGADYDLLFIDNAIETDHKRGAVVMNGRQIFKNAVNKIGEAVEKALAANHLTIDDIDWFVPHQANQRIIQGVIDLFKLPPEKVVVTVDRHANTSAASIPLALYEAVNDSRIQPGQRVLIEAMGGGLTWASSIIVWS